jgi:hypothetical protein
MIILYSNSQILRHSPSQGCPAVPPPSPVTSMQVKTGRTDSDSLTLPVPTYLLLIF